MEEEWRKIDQEPFYSVSNLGRIKRDDTGRIKSLRLDRYGYPRVTLYPSGTTYTVHRLVGFAFHKDAYSEGLQVDHIDGNKKNNRSDNLEWVTAKTNTIRAHDNGLTCSVYGELNPMCSISSDVAYSIKYSFNLTLSEATTAFGVSANIVEKIRHRQHWKHIVDKNLEPRFLSGELVYAKGKSANLDATTKATLDRMISEGYQTKDIVDAIGVSRSTVKRRKKQANS